MPGFSRTIATLVVVASLTALTAAPAVAGGSGKDKVQVTKFHVTLTSQGTTLHQVGGDGQYTYGWNLLTGTGSSDSGNIEVNLQGAVDYENGEGTFSGFITLKFASLAEVGFTMRGTTTKSSDGTSRFTSKMKVIEGTGALIGAKGTGAWKGSRSGVLGSPVEADFVIRISGIDLG
jgi:hypothetical protein